MSIKILVDSGSDITKEEAKKLGIEKIPLIIKFGEEDYFDGDNLLYTEFYNKLKESKILPKTSKINPGRFSDLYKKILNNNDEIIVITLSSKLSGTYSSAVITSKEFNRNVYVVDSGSAAIGQRLLIYKAIEFINNGCKIEEVVKKLNDIKEKITIFAIVDTLEYLKRVVEFHQQLLLQEKCLI